MGARPPRRPHGPLDPGPAAGHLPASEPDGCIVTIELRRKGQTLGRKRIELDGGEKGIARVRLSKAARALLKQKRTLAVKARVRGPSTTRATLGTRVLPLTLVKR